MIKKEPFFRAALSAALITFAGAAMAADAPGQLAQASQPGQPGAESSPGAPPAAGGTEAPPAAGGAGAPPAAGDTGAPPAAGGAAGTTGELDAKEGMDVVNAKGEKIGEVAAIEGEQIIVSVGGFLGMGAREVALSKTELQMSGTGEEAKLQTSMTQEELEKLPAHESAAPTGGAESPPPGGQMPEREGGSPPPSESSPGTTSP